VSARSFNKKNGHVTYCLGPFSNFPLNRYSVIRAVLPPDTLGYQLVEYVLKLVEGLTPDGKV
jgi:hypothetical protein